MGATFMQRSQYEQQRRQLVTIASVAILDAMDKVSRDHGELTCAEWVEVLLKEATRCNAEAMVDDWRRPQQEPSTG